MRTWTIRKFMALGLLACGAIVSRSGVASAEQFVYGISDANTIVVVDPVAKTEAVAFNTGLSGASNGVAYDLPNKRLFYRNPEAGRLYVWDQIANTQHQLTGPSLPGSTASAAFHDGAYWYVQNNTDELKRVDLDFTVPTAPVISGISSFDDFDGGNGGSSFGFGDIVITSGGTMFGVANYSGGTKLFQVSLSGGSPMGFSTIASTPELLQLSLSPDESFLYAHSHNSGKWFTLQFDGTLAAIPDGAGTFTTTRLRDLAGITAVPEPSTMVLAALGVPMIVGVGLARRRRKSS